MKFNKYWIIIAGITILNIFIFVFFSNKLESYVTDSMIDDGNKKLLDSLN
jgi:hypothetical protein